MDISGTYAANDYSSVSSSWAALSPQPIWCSASSPQLHHERRLMVSTYGVEIFRFRAFSTTPTILALRWCRSTSSYQPSTVAVNMSDLPDGVTVAENVIKETWIEGAIGYRSLGSRFR
ncbi:fimbria/pilus outer membrane usher protein [Escherichia coli]